ncbi:hypothetical protein [Variovorax soli]|uniref:Phosphoglycerate dehydrogenase-like enzyme n=1 Tax=Variovorax soli TaxID=376815 RepID=A0ABU1ND02_9BURK|nr:hypothetical protein [Variovorax soli]MDR6536301.1 phosphoglycerate dehydrogenase-like enzyme [Variovorax soli]
MASAQRWRRSHVLARAQRGKREPKFTVEQLPPFLDGCNVRVCLLPLTPATKGILNRELFA